MSDIRNKTVLITGVSSGLGRSLAQKILEKGGRVAGTFRNKSQISEFEALAPGRTVALEMDITNPAQVKAGVEKAIAAFGRIYVLANNTGHGLVGAIEETNEFEAQRMLDINFMGAIAGIAYAQFSFLGNAILAAISITATGLIVWWGLTEPERVKVRD